jgi:tRNA G26 N,N-dimethylase Trm1
MNDKAAKVAVACGDCLTKALNSFGPKTVTIATCQKNIANAFNNSKPDVRTACTNLCVEIFRWMGPLFTTWLDGAKLKPAQMTELGELFKDIEPGQVCVCVCVSECVFVWPLFASDARD